jgi:NADH-quinone oxidoreductase subunit M
VFTVFFLVIASSFSRDNQYTIGIVSSAISLIASLILAGSIRGVGFQETVVFQVIPSIFVNFRFGVDGISLPFILLTNLFQYLCILSLSPATPRILDAMLALFLLQAGVLATFAALDILAFFFFFELTLLPIYFLVLR